MNDFSFSRRLRLLNSHDFKQVFDQADIKISHGVLLILGHRTKPDSAPRLGLIAAKKNLKDATDRNQFKRQVRESFRLNRHRFQGIDLIVMARSGARELDKAAIRAVIEQCWGRLVKRLDQPVAAIPRPSAEDPGS